MLVGNKCDCASARVVSKARGQHLASSFGILFREVSMKDDATGVNEVYNYCAPHLKSTFLFFRQLKQYAGHSSLRFDNVTCGLAH